MIHKMIHVLKEFFFESKYTLYVSLLFVGIIFFILLQYGVKDTNRDIQDTTSFSVITRNHPSSYYENKEGDKEGFEYDLIQSFAKYIGKTAIIKTGEKVNDILREINSEDTEFDLAAASLAKEDEREKKSIAGPVYDELNYLFICNKNVSLNNVKNSKISIPAEAFYTKSMQQLNISQYTVEKESSSEDLFQKVQSGQTECTFADERIFQTLQHFYPDLQTIQTEESKKFQKKLVWYINKQSPIKKADLEKWLKEIKSSGEYDRIKDRYFGHIEEKDYFDSKVLQERIKERLPLYRPLFEEAEKKFDISWIFLAAISYQESHWDPKAQSPTGVRGMMMLTQKTANSLGVKNRLDPKESVMGGAKYLKSVIDQIPDYIEGEDRLFMALASYNVGIGHLEDARAIAIWQNKNPNDWAGVKEVLPLLSLKKYYRYLPRGYARGSEPVQYVQRIRNYHDMIKSTFKVSDVPVKKLKRKRKESSGLALD